MSPVHANYLTFMQTPHARLQFLKTVIVTELYNDNVQLATFKKSLRFSTENNDIRPIIIGPNESFCILQEINLISIYMSPKIEDILISTKIV